MATNETKQKEDFGSQLDRLTGRAVVAIGEGQKFRSIISGIVFEVNQTAYQRGLMDGRKMEREARKGRPR